MKTKQNVGRTMAALREIGQLLIVLYGYYPFLPPQIITRNKKQGKEYYYRRWELFAQNKSLLKCSPCFSGNVMIKQFKSNNDNSGSTEQPVHYYKRVHIDSE